MELNLKGKIGRKDLVVDRMAMKIRVTKERVFPWSGSKNYWKQGSKVRLREMIGGTTTTSACHVLRWDAVVASTSLARDAIWTYYPVLMVFSSIGLDWKWKAWNDRVCWSPSGRWCNVKVTLTLKLVGLRTLLIFKRRNLTRILEGIFI